MTHRVGLLFKFFKYNAKKIKYEFENYQDLIKFFLIYKSEILLIENKAKTFFFQNSITMSFCTCWIFFSKSNLHFFSCDTQLKY